ncbi:FxsB family cyclophane-forming radical SAM/SPASM peptide maturase [Lentzea flava]|nr:FxsB family cyclophane-forming radical SAM/SPASM peptide maturase [Lentzea flava]MCP2203327.1 uncharacterized protein [Lentzea flava]
MESGAPFRQFILKVHGRCDLACDHCYVYTKADQRWRLRDRMMSREIVDHVARRMAAHVRTHGLSSVDVVLHGGEPLLAGRNHLEYCVRSIRDACAGCDVRFGLQTNGMLLSSSFLSLFASLGVRVGVSVDGYQEAHDRHRRRHDGSGSFDAVAAALAELREWPEVYAGLLCTVDLANDPVRTYEALLEFSPPAVDFLLPNGNWSSPPPGRGPRGTPYADWLVAVFDRWYPAVPQETTVRLFTEIITVLLGGWSRVEGIGTTPHAMIVVETDGSIELSDMVSTAFDGAGATGLNVARDDFDTAARHPAVRAARTGVPPPACRDCELRRVCGGGSYAHRYREGAGFDGPSVYCLDLFRLISHVRDRVGRDVALLAGRSG